MRSSAMMLVLFCCGLIGGPAIGGIVEIDDAAALSGGVTAGDGPGYPVTLSEAGSYRLTGNLKVPGGNVIDVASDRVTIDLNGYGITCSPGCPNGNGISAAPLQTGLRIRNGFIRGMGERGISGGSGSMISGVEAIDNGGAGIVVGPDSILVGNTVRNNGGAFTAGLLAGSRSVLVGNASFRNSHTGIGGGAFSVVMDNVAIGNARAGTLPVSSGIRSAASVIQSNLSSRNERHGLLVQQSGSVVGNVVTDNLAFGLFSEGFGTFGYAENTIEDNTAGPVGGVAPLPIEIGTNLCEGNTTCP